MRHQVLGRDRASVGLPRPPALELDFDLAMVLPHAHVPLLTGLLITDAAGDLFEITGEKFEVGDDGLRASIIALQQRHTTPTALSADSNPKAILANVDVHPPFD